MYIVNVDKFTFWQTRKKKRGRIHVHADRNVPTAYFISADKSQT